MRRILATVSVLACIVVLLGKIGMCHAGEYALDARDMPYYGTEYGPQAFVPYEYQYRYPVESIGEQLVSMQSSIALAPQRLRGRAMQTDTQARSTESLLGHERMLRQHNRFKLQVFDRQQKYFSRAFGTRGPSGY